MSEWYLYILKCRDGSLYTGITTDVERRLAEHLRSGPPGSKYLKGRAPLTLMLKKKVGDRRTALKAENRVKRLSRAQKEQMVAVPACFEEFLNRLGR